MSKTTEIATQAGIALGSSLAIGTALGISPLESLVIGTTGAVLMKAQEYVATDLLPSGQHDRFLTGVRYAAIGTTAAIFGGLDAYILSKTQTPLSKGLLLQGGAYSAVNLLSLITTETPEELYKIALKKGRNGLIALGIVLAGYFAPDIHISHISSATVQKQEQQEVQSEAPAEGEKTETTPKDTGDALAQYVQQLAQTEAFTFKAYSQGFRQGDLVVVEFDPAKQHPDNLKLSYTYRQTEKGRQVTQAIQTTTIDGKTYGFVAIDFKHPAQTVDITVSASLDGYKFTEKYPLTFSEGEFEKQKLPKKSSITSSTQKTPAQKRATTAFYNSWKKVTPELYTDHYSPSIAKACNVAGFGSYRSWEGQKEPGRHNGIDCGGTTDDPVQRGDSIYAVLEGIVTYASPEQLQDVGITTTINHGLGLYTWYAHQSKEIVAQGQRVEAGEKIGEAGSTGRSTGPHLHIGGKLYSLNINPDSLQILSLVFDNDNR